MTRAFTPERRRIATMRLAAQRIAGSTIAGSAIAGSASASPVDTVRHLLAVQAQDFPGAKWTVGLRTPGSTDAAIEAELAAATIVRSWPMRGTLHFTAAEDLGWMLSLTADRIAARAAGRHRQLGISDDDLATCRAIAERLLADGPRSRSELVAAFDAAGQPTAAQRGNHILLNLSIYGTLVFGPVTGKQQSFALLDDWVRSPRRLDRDEALAEFALRYFTSHGPATVNDFAWWASLTLTDARAGLAAVSDHLESFGDYWHAPGLTPADGVFALPGFDEFLLGYSDRSAALHSDHAERVVPGSNGMFMPTVVVDGEVVGTWKRAVTAKGVTVTSEAFGALSARHAKGFAAASARYAQFMGTTLRGAD